jgi:predicted secreted Zn-dependent protease
MKMRFLAAGFLWMTMMACALQKVSTGTPTQEVRPTVVEELSIQNARLEYYEIYGDTENKLRNQMNLLGPVDYLNYRGDATTFWFASWTWDGYGKSNCDLSTTKVELDVRLVFPHWRPPKSAPSSLITKWNSYILALARHEQHHIDNVVSRTPQVLSAIKGATCTTAEGAAQAVLDDIRKVDADFDLSTDHGRNTGAVFP